MTEAHPLAVPARRGSGAPEEAVKRLRHLLSIPAGQVASIARLKIDPVWDPIRNRPDFQQLLSGTELIEPEEVGSEGVSDVVGQALRLPRATDAVALQSTSPEGAAWRRDHWVNRKNFFGELKRRNGYQVAVAYFVAGWALAQGVAQVLPVFSVPELGDSTSRGAHHTGSAGCARFGLGIRADAGGN